MTGSLLAPELVVDRWFNTDVPLDLQALRGRVVLLYAFQMLCPGCVYHTVPQARDVYEAFRPAQLAVIGLHSVFEHHEAMQPHALKVFISENRLRFPIGVDAGSGGSIPQTMRAYGMQGTPTTILIDRFGRLRVQQLGHFKDMELAAALALLMLETQERDSSEVRSA